MDETAQVEEHLKALLSVMVARAEKEVDAVMPGYTHLQVSDFDDSDGLELRLISSLLLHSLSDITISFASCTTTLSPDCLPFRHTASPTYPMVPPPPLARPIFP
jgi:hypothetical protein